MGHISGYLGMQNTLNGSLDPYSRSLGSFYMDLVVKFDDIGPAFLDKKSCTLRRTISSIPLFFQLSSHFLIEPLMSPSKSQRKRRSLPFDRSLTPKMHIAMEKPSFLQNYSSYHDLGYIQMHSYSSWDLSELHNLWLQALLSGCSAGGLTSILHCDSFHTLLPVGTKLKCLSDAGYFINAKDVSGAQHIQAFYDEVVTTHGSAKNLPLSCTSKMKPSMCFFPQNMAQGIRTPLFLVNAAYDSWQIKNILAPGVADPHGNWHYCKLDITQCSSSQLETMQGFRLQFLSALAGLGTSSSRGMFINSCYAHCQTETQETWLRDDSPVLGNTPIAKAVGDWYYERSPFQKIDCPYPCDRSCHNRVFDPNELPQE